MLVARLVATDSNSSSSRIFLTDLLPGPGPRGDCYRHLKRALTLHLGNSCAFHSTWSLGEAERQYGHAVYVLEVRNN